MARVLSADEVNELLAALCGTYDVTFSFGRLRLLSRTLPGKAVCAILPEVGDGVFRLVYDTSKPNVFRHTQAMIRDWWESFREPEVFPDGTVELLQRICPEVPQGPVAVAVLPREPVD